MPHCPPLGAPPGLGPRIQRAAEALPTALSAVTTVMLRMARRFFILTSDFRFDGLVLPVQFLPDKSGSKRPPCKRYVKNS